MRKSLRSYHGLTNGRERFGRKNSVEKKNHLNKVWISLILCFFCVSLFQIYKTDYADTLRIKIDGKFEDWADIPKITDRQDSFIPQSVDLCEYAYLENRDFLFFYLKTYGNIMTGDGREIACSDAGATLPDMVVSKVLSDAGEDVAYIFVDVDACGGTGYALSESFGSDYAIQITGKNNRITSSYLLAFKGCENRQWLWQIVSAIDCGVGSTAIEAGVLHSKMKMAENYSIIFCLIGWDGKYDSPLKNVNLGIKTSGMETWEGESNITYFSENAYFIDVSGKLGLHLGENENKTFLYPVYSNSSTWLYSLTDQNKVLRTYPHLYDGTNVTNITQDIRNVTSPYTPGEVYGVGWNGTHWLIGGTCRDGEGYPYLVSYDGVTFTNINLSHSPFGRFKWGAICSAVWNGTHWLIGDTEHTLALFDGSTFTNLTPKLEALGWSMPNGWTREQHLSIGWNGTHWLIMVGNASNNATSYKPANIVVWDGADNWTDLTLKLDLPVWDIGTYRIAWNGNFWLFGTAESSWDNYGIPSPPESQVIKYDGENFTRIGGLFANSTDISDVVWNGNYFVICGWNHTRNVSGLPNYTETQVYVWDGTNAPLEITDKIEGDVGYVKAQHAMCGGFAAFRDNCWLMGGIKSQFPHMYTLASIIETNVSEELILNTTFARDVDGGYIVNWTWNISGQLQYGEAVINFTQPGIYNCKLKTTDNDNQSFEYNFSVVVHGGWLNGTISPENATVFVDGNEIPVSNGTFNVSLSPGTHAVNATAQNYEWMNQSVSISDFAETCVHISLIPVGENTHSFPYIFSVVVLALVVSIIKKFSQNSSSATSRFHRQV
ncbi:MAG: hypothetical protein N3F63_03720 [Thermoplasmata archaeon]|nr:hypothetical protein [Thermoplasmata archaeon]